MSKSRILYAKKLLDKYQDNFIRGFRYRSEIILPRFMHNILGELRRATLFYNNNYTKQMRDDLAELYPYMNAYLKIKCKVILIFLQYQPFKLFTNILAKIYWRFNKIGERY